MKTATLLLALALTGCSAFTAPKDPVTGIRQDKPAHWSETNPLDTLHTAPAPHPAEGRFGRSWKGYRGF